MMPSLIRIKFFVLLFWCLSIAICTSAQIPQFGIYRLSQDNESYFPASYYAKDIYNIGSYFEVDLVPEQEVATYNLAYAIVAVDSSSGIMKIVFLPDSVSKLGKTRWQSLAKSSLSTRAFAQEWRIKGDSVLGKQNFDQWFPINRRMQGISVFNKNNEGLMTFVKPQPKVKRLQRFDSSSMSYQNGNRYTFEQSFFTPFFGYGAPAYKDLIYTYDKGKIPIYKNPNDALMPYHYFHQGEFIAVLKDSANWLFVHKLVVIPDSQTYYLPDAGGVIQRESKLHLIPGWVRKGDLAPYPWVKQEQETKAFRFEVSGNINADDDWNSDGRIYGIKIINKKTGSVQIINELGDALSGKLNEVVQVQDCNFDGFPDIWIYAHNGGAGPNDGNDYFLYSPQKKCFEYSEQLSALTQVIVDSKAKTITSAFRDGAAHHGGATYTFSHDTLSEIGFWDSYWHNDYFADNSESHLENGKWQNSHSYMFFIDEDTLNLLAQPDKNAQSLGLLKKGAEVNILKQNRLWFYIFSTTIKGEHCNGWLRKQAVLPAKWLPFKAHTNQFQFFASSSDSISVAAIGIKDNVSGKFIQIIPSFEGLYLSDSLFQVGDFNQDSLADFRLNIGEKDSGQPLFDDYIYNNISKAFEIEKVNN